MPWKERTALDERRRLIEDWAQGRECVAELCRQYGISRQTAYKWRARYQADPELGLEERSRAPERHPQAMLTEVAEQIVALREEHPRWGPRKLKAALEQEAPEIRWPVESTIGELLRRRGLAHPRRVRQRTPPYSQPLAHATAPNQVWCADFKGWFRCGDGSRCDPLTITDGFSRMLLRCQHVEKTDGVHVRAVFEAAFREYGMPEALRTDNGTPFASRAPGGLSRLSMWWLRLGIRPERIRAGHPEQNGRHERMHRTLKEETAQPPRRTLSEQQKAFVEFQRVYNHERPHEALEYQRPAELYVASARLYPSRLKDLAYPQGAHLRRISQQGSLKWKGQRTFVSEVLAREVVGLVEIDDGCFEVYYGLVLLGIFDAAGGLFCPMPVTEPQADKANPL